MTLHRPSDPNEDFTLIHYAEILRALRADRRVLSFRDVHGLGEALDEVPKYVIMRHDVEFSLSSALRLAEIDHKEGIRSTFFLLHSSDYNIFEEEGAAIVNRIVELGHDIGLHYDAALYEIMAVDAVRIAQQQIDLMESYWNTKVYAMSSHMPMRSGSTFSLPGVLDVYEPRFIRDIKYVSDSTQRWRHGVVSQMLHQHPRIHLLMHEYYWSKEGHTWDKLLLLEAASKFDDLKRRASSNIQKYREGLRLRAHKDEAFRKRYLNDDKAI